MSVSLIPHWEADSRENSPAGGDVARPTRLEGGAPPNVGPLNRFRRVHADPEEAGIPASHELGGRILKEEQELHKKPDMKKGKIRYKVAMSKYTT